MKISSADFHCVRCGNCCRWSGPVRVSIPEIEEIAEFLKMESGEFIEKFTMLTADRRGLTLLEKMDGSCLYLSDEGCRIQPVKPGQCRAFPYEWNFPGWENECGGAKK